MAHVWRSTCGVTVLFPSEGWSRAACATYLRSPHPIDVLQVEANEFPHAQAEPAEQEQNCPLGLPVGAVDVAGCEQAAVFIRPRPARQARAAPASYLRHRAG